MVFTEKQRREYTKNIIAKANEADNMDKADERMNTSVGYKLNEDYANREMFRTLNSELTGLVVEHRYINGKFHPSLDEVELTYKTLENFNDITSNIITKTYYDSPILRYAAGFGIGNEFYSTNMIPIKYNSFHLDTDPLVKNYPLTEVELLNKIEEFAAAAQIAETTGTITTYAEYSYDQPYLSGTMINSNTTNLLNAYLFIGTPTNYAYGKVISYDVPTKAFEFVKYFGRGTVAENSTYTINETTPATLTIMIEDAMIKLRDIFNEQLHYLNNNPNKANTDNANIVTNLNACVVNIETWLANKLNLLSVTADVRVARINIYTDRTTYLKAYLTAAATLYTQRKEILEQRMSAKFGTLTSIREVEKGIDLIRSMANDTKGSVDFFKQYFIIKRVEKSGEIKRRLFVEDPTGLVVGDYCYILSDDENAPEVRAQIQHIVQTRLQDNINTKIDPETSYPIVSYRTVYKIFFSKALFDDRYKTGDNLRIIKVIN